jgi:phosphopantothenoylcysteine decarboxylase/phosphopantothenate--cysteine ligase
MELAKASARRGSPTTLLLGPVPLDQDLPADVEVVRFTTSRDLEQALARLGPGADVLIMAAAVADHRPATVHEGKWRREAGEASLALEVVPDLVAGFAASRPEIDGARRPLVVAFALEPRAELESSARAKLARKGVEMIVANPIETLGADSIEPMLIAADGRSDRPRPNGIGVSKNDFATWLLDRVTEALAAPIRGS